MKYKTKHAGMLEDCLEVLRVPEISQHDVEGLISRIERFQEANEDPIKIMQKIWEIISDPNISYKIKEKIRDDIAFSIVDIATRDRKLAEKVISISDIVDTVGSFRKGQ